MVWYIHQKLRKPSFIVVFSLVTFCKNAPPMILKKLDSLVQVGKRDLTLFKRNFLLRCILTD